MRAAGRHAARRLAPYWGVVPITIDLGEQVDLAGTQIGSELVSRGLVPPRSTVVLVSIHQDLARTDANYLKIQQL